MSPRHSRAGGNPIPVFAGITLSFLVGSLSLLLAGCTTEMKDQHHHEPLEGNAFFADGRASRPLVEGTVARGSLRTDEHLYKGTVNGAPAESFPFPVTREVLSRGRERYEIFCGVCHGLAGNGDGMIVRRGFRAAPSHHIERLRNAPPGYFYGVITNGFGQMQDYAAQIPVEDRWAIVAYVRALQLSQNARLEDVPADKRKELK